MQINTVMYYKKQTKQVNYLKYSPTSTESQVKHSVYWISLVLIKEVCNTNFTLLYTLKINHVPH